MWSLTMRDSVSRSAVLRPLIVHLPRPPVTSGHCLPPGLIIPLPSPLPCQRLRASCHWLNEFKPLPPGGPSILHTKVSTKDHGLRPAPRVPEAESLGRLIAPARGKWTLAWSTREQTVPTDTGPPSADRGRRGGAGRGRPGMRTNARSRTPSSPLPPRDALQRQKTARKSGSSGQLRRAQNMPLTTEEAGRGWLNSPGAKQPALPTTRVSARATGAQTAAVHRALLLL